MTNTPHGRGLQALILDKKGDRSYERVSRDCGGTPTRNALQKLATSPTKAFPDKVTLLGLQRGLPASIDEILSACAVSMGLLDDSRDSANLVIRGAGELPTSSQQLLISLSAEMQRLAQERDGNGYAAPITHAGESPATDPEWSEHPAEESSLEWVEAGSRDDFHPAADRAAQERHDRREHPTGDSFSAEVSTSPRGMVRPAATSAEEDELARRRRERDATSAVPEEEDALPMPEELMAGYDEPQESIRAREQQDVDAEGPQD